MEQKKIWDEVRAEGERREKGRTRERDDIRDREYNDVREREGVR
jgi:hypothetical protein